MNAIIIGRRGTGKSTFAEFLALELNRHVIIYDPNCQYRNADICTSNLSSFQNALEDSQEEKLFIISYVPQYEDKQEIELRWNEFAKIIWQYGDYSLIIDESHLLQKPNYVNGWLDKFMRQAPTRDRGDKNPIDIIQTVHRPVDVNGIVLGLADRVYIFRTTRSRDLEYLENEFGPYVREEVQTLRTQKSGGRDLLMVEVEGDEQDYTRFSDSDEWYINIRKEKESTWKKYA